MEDREALQKRFATIVDVELKKIEDPLVGAFARAYAAKAGATLTRLRPMKRATDLNEKTRVTRACFLTETLRSALTDFADVVDLFEYPEYAEWKRRDRAARDAERARESEDLIDAIENFFVDAFNDEWVTFEDGEDDRETVDALRSGSRTALDGEQGADAATGALAALRDEKRKESVAEAMAWSARVDGPAEAQRRPMKRALNVAYARACLEEMSADDAAAAAGTFAKLLTRAAGPGKPDAKGDDDVATVATVDPAVLDCVRILGARLSETPPPEAETRGGALADAWSVVATAGGKNRAELSSFLRCAETWTDFAAAHVRDEDAPGEEIPTVASLLRDVAAKVTSCVRRPGPSGAAAAPPTLDEDDQAAVERVLTRATKRARDRGDSALIASEPFGALVATLRGAARASFARNALRTLLRDSHVFSPPGDGRGGSDSRTPILAREAARALLDDAAAAAHASLATRDDATTPNETDRLLARYVRANVSHLRDRGAFREALRFLARARVAFPDSDAAQREAALSAAWLGAAKSLSARFAAELSAFCEVTAMGVRDGEARVRLYLSAACAASLRGDEAAARRRVRLVREAVADLARGGGFDDASAAETACLCAAALATLDDAPAKKATSGSSSGTDPGGEPAGISASSRRALGVLARFVSERRWKEGSADRVAANLAVARAAAALARRETTFETAKAFSRRRVALLEVAHACLQTAVDVSETVDATLGASETRAAAILDVAECVSSSFAATKEMRDLASALVRRAREDSADARDRRVRAVGSTVGRFCGVTASEAGETLGVRR